MLVITRRVNQSIRIGDKIEIKIVGIDKGKVKVGISAPLDVPIYREELYQSLVEGNRGSVFASQDMVLSLRKVLLPTSSSEK
ncbi:MAG: carbon storage regulator CsrA [Candidatus Atribacteria bacterium]|nr:carbon storage regulator CsrA [Candidatus Atribacteria bacterium]